MAWDIRSAYYYLVCFATLLMIVLGLGTALQRTIDLLLPDEPQRPTLAEMEARYVVKEIPENENRYTRDELERMAQEEAAHMFQQQQRRAVRGLLGSLVMVFIAAPVYWYHWRQIKRI